MSEAQRIDALKKHPTLRAVLAQIPDDNKRDVILRCILSSKRDFPLSREDEDAAFEIFADAAIDHIQHIIEQVMDALNA